MLQTKSGSFYEAVISTAIGFGLSFVMGHVVFPLYGWELSVGDNLQITLIFTVLSIVRGYVLRRFFNSRLKALAQRMAGESRGV